MLIKTIGRAVRSNTLANSGRSGDCEENYTQIRLFIASPGVVTPGRDRLPKVVQEFNQPNGFLDECGVTLPALDWRSHVAPLMGRPEAVVLEQLPIETWDIVVGTMWSRFGTATGGVDPQTGFSFDSGTEEESTLDYPAWQEKQRPQLLFNRCMRPIPPRNLNISQYQRLEEFVKEFSREGKHPGFVQEFETSADFASHVRLDLERLLLKLRPTSAPPPVSVVQTLKHAPARERYLDTMIRAHQPLPVAGFEANLRIPIPLEKVYVTRKARLNELEHARAGSACGRAALQSDQTVTVPHALRYALPREYDGLVLLAHSGAGKTTRTKYFLLCFAGNKAEQQLGMPQSLLPILLSLRDIDPEQSLTANILAALQKYRRDLPEEFFLHYLQKGRAILLLDGLDEVPTEKKRALVSQWIHQQAHLAFPKGPVIVTSRFSGYRGEAILPGNYLRLETQDCGMPEVQQFLENWLIGVATHVHEGSDSWRLQAKSQAENLFQRIMAAPALRELAVNPLMLQIIVLVHRDRGTLPERRIELYQRVHRCFAGTLGQGQRVGSSALRGPGAPALAAHRAGDALRGKSARGEQNRAAEVHAAASRPHEARGGSRGNAAKLAGSQRHSQRRGRHLLLHHPSFQEYVTAEEICNTWQSDILVKQFDQAWWREPTLLAMCLTNPPFSRISCGFAARAMARRCTGGFPAVLRR